MPRLGEAGAAGPGPGEVHIWMASLDVAAGRLEELRRTLGPDEEQRAARFGSAVHRRRFLARRGLRRAVLARYAGRPPGSLRFGASPAGKPELAGGGDLSFSCSQSDGLALYAVARGRRVGIDIERLRPVADAMSIARALFTPAEAAGLGAVPAGGRDEAFLRSWTRKEACLKACGEGLGGGLDRFVVRLAPPHDSGDAEIVRDGADRWRVRAFTPAPGYVGAAAADGPPWQARCRTW